MDKRTTPDSVHDFGRRIRIGMVGGGVDSVIGAPHLLGQKLSGMFEFVAGAMSIDPDVAIDSGRAALVAEDRAYTDWRVMLERETARPDGIEAVVVATPPGTHLEIAREFLRAGIHVLCEKPLTVTAAEAEELAEEVERAKGVFAVGHYFVGYPMIREVKHLIDSGQLGDIRLLEATFAPGFAPTELEQPRAQRHWRFRPEAMGKSALLGEVGSHAQQMLEYLTGQRVASVAADMETIEPGREVYDNAYLSVRFDNGVPGRIWNSYVAVGNEHGFSFRIFGSEASVAWDQEDPEHLDLRDWTGLRTRLSKGGSYLSSTANVEARFPTGHPEGWGFAIGNIYRAWGESIIASELGRESVDVGPLPGIEDALSGMKLIAAADRSQESGGGWVTV